MRREKIENLNLKYWRISIAFKKKKKWWRERFHGEDCFCDKDKRALKRDKQFFDFYSTCHRNDDIRRSFPRKITLPLSHSPRFNFVIERFSFRKELEKLVVVL